MISSRREVVLGACLLGVSVAAWLWLRSEMEVVEARLAARQTQLQSLAGLRERAAQDGWPESVDLAAFAGLFAGYELATTPAPTGNCLVLRAATTEAP